MEELPVRCFQADTIDSLLDLLRTLVEECFDENSERTPQILFRGHREANWDLVSLYHRQLREPQMPEFLELYEKLARAGQVPRSWCPATEWDLTQREHWVSKARKHMVAYINDFVRHAMAAKQLHGIAAVEASRALNIAGIERARLDPSSEPTLFALAQHHGLATPLLDWTTNYHVALWFIVDDVLRKWKERDDKPDPKDPEDRKKAESRDHEMMAEVWGMPTSCFVSGRPRLQIAIDQAYPAAQSGLFVYDHSFEDTFKATGAAIPMDALMNLNGSLDQPLGPPFRVQFPHSLVRGLRNILHGMGYSTATLKPSMDNIARYTRFGDL